MMRDGGQDGERRLRPHARHTDQTAEAVELLARGEAVDVEGVLFDVAVGKELGRLAVLQPGERIVARVARVADAAAVDDREVRVEQRDGPI